MRKVQDYYFKKAKKDKYPARSVYKLEEIQQKYRLLKKGDRVLDIGCYPGSWSLYASETVGIRGVVVGVDLQEAGGLPRPDGADIQWLQYDITEPAFIDRVRRICPTFRAVISDIAPKTTGNRWTDHQQSMRLVERSLDIADALLLEKGNYLCKAFQGEDMPAFVSRMKGCFKTTRVIKPDSSRRESREVFLLGMQFRKNVWK